MGPLENQNKQKETIAFLQLPLSVLNKSKGVGHLRHYSTRASV